MRERLISAAVLVPVVIIVFLLGDPWLSLGIAILAGMAAVETSRLVRSAGLQADTRLTAVLAVLAVILTRVALGPVDFGAFELRPPSPEATASLVVGSTAFVVVVAGFVALRHIDPVDGFRSWSGNLFSILYPGLLAAVAGILAVAPQILPNAALAGRLDEGRAWLLILVLTVWSFDSFAYVAGKYHGRGRFMNHISPNKTWSGVVGGTIAATLVCALLVWATGHHWLGGAFLGLVIAVAAQAGDLVESVLKRAARAKDSGNILPGHGGILDRVDSFLFAAPAMFMALTLFQLLTVTRPA